MTKEQMLSALERALPIIALELQNSLKLVAPVDTGRLRNSIKVVSTQTGLEIFIVEYAIYVEFGRPPSVIKPKDKKALHWKNVGKDVFAKKVNHPGIRPNPFIRNTLRKKLPEIIIKNIEREMSA